jgi:bifunctional UDP-N-acetylglucosamine pyrophosphorylase/glucosamine-1-phosphate N-acetyltransferase
VAAKNVTAVVLAAGQGKRMKSALPKVLHPLCGRAMVDYVVAAALDAGADDAVVVVGHGRGDVEAHLDRAFPGRVRAVIQEEQRGTGHAVSCALPALGESHAALILYGDTPLVLARDLERLLALRHDGDRALAMLTCMVADPSGYGRIVRAAGNIVAVREHRDASPDELAIGEINPGMYAARVDFLAAALPALSSDNDQGELYLTDIVARAATTTVVGGLAADATTLAGVNDRHELASAEALMHERIAASWRRHGATLRTSARVDAGVVIEPDAVIEHGVVLRGATRIGTGAIVDVGSVLDDVEVAAGAVVKPYTVGSDSRIGEQARVGPFSHLRPKSRIDEEAHVGNFVETKATHLKRGAKANHLAYLGDGEIGEGANVGAGTIFCNYDGFQKHRTVIDSGAFIGSDSQLVAPVHIGAGAYVATGTTVTRDVPADALAIGRARQDNKEGYASRLKGRLKAAASSKK